MIYVAILSVIVFISMFFNGVQSVKNGKVEKQITEKKKELKELKGE